MLAAILRQNPDVAAGMTSPVAGLMGILRQSMSQNPEVSSLINDEQRERILRGVFNGFYEDQKEKPLIFDTNRNWTGRIPELKCLFGDEFKIIAMVRNPAWIFDSIERILVSNPLRQSKLMPPNLTIQSRAETAMAFDGIIGGPLGHLMNALAGESSNQLLLVDYDALCANPAETIDAIYRFVGAKPYAHDFSSLEYKQEVFDDALMTPGLHKVSGAVRVIERKTILPFEIFDQLSRTCFWRNDMDTNAGRIVLE